MVLLVLIWLLKDLSRIIRYPLSSLFRYVDDGPCDSSS